MNKDSIEYLMKLAQEWHLDELELRSKSYGMTEEQVNALRATLKFEKDLEKLLNDV